jgi:tetratricopeptide (TPR) repeat protein
VLWCEMRLSAFDVHYRAGWSSLKAVMLTDGNESVEPQERELAERAIREFEVCLSLRPDSWQCLWAIGKSRQAISDHRAALMCFEKAAAISASNVDVLREAGIAACALGESEVAVKYAMAALRLRPADSTLNANAAVAFVLAGDDVNAECFAQLALKLAPADRKNIEIVQLVQAVRSGDRARPLSL